MKAGVVAALVGSAAAAAHQGHNGFHFRRHATASEEGVCTVYTTVYVTASAVPVPSSATYSAIPTSVLYSALSSASISVPAPAPTPESSTSCTESTSVSVPVPAPSAPAPSVSSSSVYVPVPAPSAPGSSIYVSVPVPAPSAPVPAVSSSSVYVPVPAPSAPAPGVSSSSVYVPVPAPSAPGSISVPAPVPTPSSSTSCTESSSVHVSVPAPSAPAPVVSSSSVYVSVPAPSISSSSVYVPVPAPSVSSSSVYVPVPAPSSYSSVVVSVPAPSTSSKPVAVPTSSKPSVVPSSTKSETSKPTGGSGYATHLVPNGQKLSITYTPYASDGNCMTASQVKTDLAKIAALGYPTIRVYSTDCGVFENVVPEATKNGLKIIYGIFLDENKAPGSTGANEQLDAIIKNAPKDSFSMLIVGNEYISGHGGSAATLAPYITTCKEKLIAAGFPSTIPVTTTETVGALEQYGSALCDSIDVLAAQIHPFFDGGVPASGAGEFAVKQLAQAAKVCPEAASRGQYITEIGWPMGGSTNGVAVPGVAEQKEAIASIIKSVGEKATLFSWQNDDWKAPGSLGVEQKFGCSSVLA